jgi:hypothetical protein
MHGLRGILFEQFAHQQVGAREIVHQRGIGDRREPPFHRIDLGLHAQGLHPLQRRENRGTLTRGVGPPALDLDADVDGGLAAMPE